MNNHTAKNKAAFLIALEKNLGVISSACKAANISRPTYYDWYKNDPEFKAACDDINDIAIDFVENKLYQRIKGVKMVNHTKDADIVYEVPPSDTAIIFYLKTKGKKRGYIEKTEIEHSGTITVGLPDELL